MSPPSPPESRTWAIYVRVSTRHQAETGFSLPDQRETLIAFAEQQSWAYEVFEDGGASGETLDERPGMLALLAAADSGRLSGVLVMDESRLARDETIAALIRQRLKKADLKIATPSRGTYDLSVPSENFAATVLAAAHAFDQDLRTAKTKRGRKLAVEAGYWPGGPPPFGYRTVPKDGHKVLEIDEEQAQLIRLVFELIVNHGYSTYQAAIYLNTHGHRTVRGSLWRGPNLCYRLRQPSIAGRWTYKTDGIEIEVPIPQILTKKEWETLQSSIKGQPRSQRSSRLYPLTGRDRCHLRCVCGGNYFGKTDKTKKGRSYYECSKNHHTFLDARCHLYPRLTRSQDLDQAVWEQVARVLTDKNILTALAREYLNEQESRDIVSEMRDLERHLARLRTEQTNLVRELAAKGNLGDDVLRPALDEVVNERKQVEKEIARVEQAGHPNLADGAAEGWVEQIVELASRRLSNPDTQTMAAVFDVIDLDLLRTKSHQYEGIMHIPLTAPEARAGQDGEVPTEEPPRHAPHRRR